MTHEPLRWGATVASVLLFLSSIALGQTKESLEQRMSPKPSGTAGDIPYAVSTTTIGWIAHATGTKCLQQVGSAAPTWVTCGATSPLTTKGDLWTFSTVDTRLPVGTNGYVLMADSAQTTGLSWINPNVSTNGWVRLQSSYPGSQQTGSFNVDGDVGFGGFTSTYTGSTIASQELNTAALGTFIDKIVGKSGDTTNRWHLWTTGADGSHPGMYGWYPGNTNRGDGVYLAHLTGSPNKAALCVNTDSGSTLSGSGGNTISCAGAFNVGHGNAGFVVDDTGTIQYASGHVFGTWPAKVNNACLRTDGIGTMGWDTACGGTIGTVTSVGLSLPAMFTVSGSPVTSTGTLTAVLANQNANLFLGGPTTGSPAAPTFRQVVSADLGLTTKGDLLTHSTVLSRLGVGTDGYVLYADSGQTVGLRWGASVNSLAVPSELSSSGSTGAITLTWANETAHYVFAGPPTGPPATPGFRLLVGTDIPAFSGATSIANGTLGGVPQPLAGDQGKCLLGNATWGSCASGAVGSIDGISGTITLVAGTGITITDNSPSAGSITIAASGGGGTTALKQDEFTGDGSTTVFTLTATPVTGGVAYVALNGLPQLNANWAVSGTTLTMTTAPITGAKLVAGYYTTLPGSVTHTQEDFTGAGSTDFTLAHTPATNGVLLVALRGLVQTQTTWSLVGGTTLRFTSSVPSGDKVSISYNY